jgi:hypothetical protein
MASVDTDRKKKGQSFHLGFTIFRGHDKEKRRSMGLVDETSGDKQKVHDLETLFQVFKSRIGFKKQGPRDNDVAPSGVSNTPMVPTNKGKQPLDKSNSEPGLTKRKLSKIITGFFNEVVTKTKSSVESVKDDFPEEPTDFPQANLPENEDSESSSIFITTQNYDEQKSRSADPTKLIPATLPNPSIESKWRLSGALRSSPKTESGFDSTTRNSDYRGQIDDVIEKVPFAGIFSTSTTSSKPPAAMRLDILAALEKIKKDFPTHIHERRGCIVVNIVLPSQEPTDLPRKSIESVSISGRPSLSYSVNTDLEDLTAEGDPDIKSVVRSSKVSLDIRIFKIKIMKVWCIRFRRMSGDTWKYKGVCDRIVRELGW